MYKWGLKISGSENEATYNINRKSGWTLISGPWGIDFWPAVGPWIGAGRHGN